MDNMYISNFLGETLALDISEKIDKIPIEYWNYVFNTGECKTYSIKEENFDDIDNEIAYTDSFFLYGYRYKQISDFTSDNLVEIYNFIDTDLKIKLKSCISDTSNIEIVDPFISLYHEGDYQNVNPDKKNDHLFFSYSLTNDWGPFFGGCLSFWNKETETINKTFFPKFNSLTIFEVNEENNQEYFVTKVSGPGVRLSIEGWINVLN
jgi:Rps23 Pro-64 3,4-dihydroxylase Tpa1-like proline 4-hydroxylase